MSEQRRTCFGCSQVSKEKIAMGGCLAYCSLTGNVVPQSFQSDPPLITYWRVPMNCPLPDTEVVKSETKAPVREWQTEILELRL